MAQVYTVNDSQAGKSLDELQRESGLNYRPDILAGFLGVDQNAKLTSGQSLTANLPANYQNSGESQALSSLFGTGMSQEMAAAQPAIKSLQSSIPEVQQQFKQTGEQLNAQIEPLNQRYKTLIDGLTNTKNQQVSTAQTAAAREFGKRGVPLSSGSYDQYLAGSVNPIEQNWGNLITQGNQNQTAALSDLQNLIANLAPQETSAERNIYNAIAALQSGAGKDAITNALAANSAAEQTRQFDSQQALARDKFNFDTTQTGAQDLSKNYATLGEGSTLYNLLTGGSYTAPKTYAPSSATGGGGW